MIDPFERVPFGRTGLEVTRLGLGTAPFATIYWENDADSAIGTARRALEAGIRLFDTAPFYGLGEAEERLGVALAEQHPADVVLTTKAGRTLERGPDGSIDAVFDFSAEAARRGLEASLERLGVDAVDIVHIHDPDDHLPEALVGTYTALATMRSEGMIKAVSVGANAVEPIEFLVREADLDSVLLAGRYTLLDQRAAATLLPLCHDRGIAFIAAGVFNSGILADPVEGAWYDYGPADAERLTLARAIAACCTEHGVPLRTAALHFPYRHPDVTTVVVGMSTAGEVDENLAALGSDVPDDLWTDLAERGLISRNDNP